MVLAASTRLIPPGFCGIVDAIWAAVAAPPTQALLSIRKIDTGRKGKVKSFGIRLFECFN
jgi:hypothetical protein